MRLRLWIALAFTFAVTMIAGAQAPTLADRAAAIDRVVTQPEGYRVVVGHISRELVIVVDTLRAQKAQTGLSWGEILVAHRVSREAKVSFDQIAAEYRTGKSWEDLVRDHKADLQKITAAIQRSQSVVEQRAEDKAPPPTVGTPSVAPPGVPASRY
jgi:hypothetical protein